MAKSLRVFELARTLGVDSKDIIAKCGAEGVELKNHMAAVSPGLAESIREWFTPGEDVTTVEVAERVDFSRKKRAARKTASNDDASGGDSDGGVAVADAETTEVAEPPSESSEAPEVVKIAAAAAPAAEETPSVEIAAEAESEEPPAPQVVEEIAPPAVAATVTETLEPEAKPEAPEPATHKPVPMPPPPPKPKPRQPAAPVGPQLVPKPAELKGPRVVRIEAPEPMPAPRPRPRPSPTGAGGAAARGPIALPPSPSVGPRKKRPGGGDWADDNARKGRTRRDNLAEVESKTKEWRDQDLIERQERLRNATGQGLLARRAAERRRHSGGGGGASGQKAKLKIEAPLPIKEFCSAIGTPFGALFKKLIEHTGRPWNVNEIVDADTVTLLAADLGIDIEVVHARTEYERLVDEVESRERAQLTSRPPVVTILGHVDHGKTSLLDKIRDARVAAGEAGGITQHIGAYRVSRENWDVTFLDTPGHAAFTAMRARGADLTDVVVLVVAADDGVMPQTVEAINHAKAAGVEIVVALNKIDLPGADPNRVYGQLAEHELVPSEWGGKIDVVKTSAATGEGVGALLDHLTQLSELMDLKADATVPAVATVIEAQRREGQGNVAQLLIREGTLKIGQTFVCGPAAGRVRQLRNDRGKTMKDATPGTPVELSGLDELPRAGDSLYVLSDLNRAKEIATEVQQKRRAEELQSVQGMKSSLEDLLRGADADEVPELGVILKADVQGSLDALKVELGKLPSNKVKLVFKHVGVGAINEADVDLAHVTKAIVVGFHVVADHAAQRRADELGVEIRLYRVIYEIMADVEKALTGLLAPMHEQQQHGMAEVRKVFNVSRLGTIAGCLVKDGTIARNHKVRVVRDGRIVLEGAAIDSLKRFKDDAREVRAGLECGIKLVNFDDLKPGDEIQTYSLVEVAQSL